MRPDADLRMLQMNNTLITPPIDASTVVIVNAIQRLLNLGELFRPFHVIAGGYPRDIYYGQTPRDVDIWVFGEYTSAYVDWFISNLDELGMPASEIQIYRGHTSIHEERNDEAITDVVKIGRYIDVIFLTGVSTARGVTDRFDTNLNQFCMTDLYTAPYFSGGIEPWDTLVKVRPSVHTHRLIKSVRKAREINASTVLGPEYDHRLIQIGEVDKLLPLKSGEDDLEFELYPTGDE